MIWKRIVGRAGARAPRGVVFLAPVPSRIAVSPQTHLDISLASARLRMLIPALQLARRVPVWLVPYAEFLAEPKLAFCERPVAVVLAKVPVNAVLESRATLAALLDRLGEREDAVFADFSDDYAAIGRLIGQPYLANYQRRVGEVAQLIACGDALAQALRPHAREGLHVIEDPYESALPGVPRVPGAGSGAHRLLWFGNFGAALHPFLREALGGVVEGLPDRAIELELVCGERERGLAEALGVELGARHPRLQLRFTPWSLAATEEALARCDVVLLPQEQSEHGRVKSANRLVSALRAGRLAVASPIPAYEALAAHAWVGNDLAAGVRWAHAHPQEALQRVVRGQAVVETRFSPEAIGARWAEVLRLV